MLFCDIFVIYDFFIMKNIFKRNKIYYYRVVIHSRFKKYFKTNSDLYIKSLKTSNKKEAIILANYLNSRLNYIKSSHMLLTNEELKNIFLDFTSTNLEAIKNRHKQLTINEIDKLIDYYNNSDVDVYDDTLSKELEALDKVFVENNINTMFDTDQQDIEYLVDKIKQFKIFALNQAKLEVEKVIIKDTNTKQINTIEDRTIINTIEDCKLLFLKSHDKKLRYEQNIDLLIKYLNKRKISNIEDVTHSIIKDFRNDYYKTNTEIRKTTINNCLTHLHTFFKFCKLERLYPYENPCENSHFNLSVFEKSESQRDCWTDEDVKKILNNLDILKINQRTKKFCKYAKEYKTIILIAMYSGARESEICQLKVSDVLQEEESKINYFRFIVESEEESKKNANSWRFVPIHKDLEPYIFDYIKNMDKRRKGLFTISGKQFGKDFSKYKTILKFDRKKVFHSFRHSIANKLKNQAKDVEVGKEITGHAKNTSFNRYAKNYDLVNKKEVIDKIFYKLD